MGAILEPKLNFSILPIQQVSGVREHKVLIIGQMLTGTALPKELITDIGNDGAENILFGAKSHISEMIRNFKKDNKISQLDAIAFEDVTTGDPVYTDIKIIDAPTAAGQFSLSVGSEKSYTYTFSVSETDNINNIAQAIIDSINADTLAPFTAALGPESWIVRISMANTGKIGEDWSIRLKNQALGLNIDIDDFHSGGAGNPILSGVFDLVGEIRYQTIIWPSVYPTEELENFLNPRFNADNQILDGIGFQAHVGNLEDVKDHAAQNSQSVVIIGDKKLVVSTQAKMVCSVPSGPVANFQPVLDGSFKINVDGVEEDITDLDFTLTPARLQCGTSGTLVSFQNVTDGSFKVTIDGGTEQDITGIDLEATKGSLICGTAGSMPILELVENGAFRITLNGVIHDITGLNFDGFVTYGEVEIAINAVLPDNLICEYQSSPTDHFEFHTITRGSEQSVGYLETVPGYPGDDLSADIHLHGRSGTTAQVIPGTGPNNFDEIATIISGLISGASCVYIDNHFDIISDLTGVESDVSFLTPGSIGVPISGIGDLNGELEDPPQAVRIAGTSIDNYAGIAQVINASLQRADCTYETSSFVFTSYSHGEGSSVSVLTAGSSGTDVSGTDFLNGLAGDVIAAQKALSNRSGASIPEIPDAITAQVAAIRALRFTEDANLTSYITSAAIKDQKGGIALASLPYFNTIMPNIAIPYTQDCWNRAEQDDLRDNGCSIIGVDRLENNTIFGEMVTTYLKNAQDFPDDSYKFLNTVDTSSIIREFIYENCRVKYSQTRLTDGDLIPGYNMANEGSLRVFLNELYEELADVVLVQKGAAALKDFNENLIITTDVRGGEATIDCAPLLVSQLRAILGTIRVNFGG